VGSEMCIRDRDYFDRNPDLESFLKRKQETRLLNLTRDLSTMANITYVRQQEQLGLGHAISVARDIINQEPFAVFLPDDVIIGRTPVIKQLMAVYNQYQSSVIAVQAVPKRSTPRYGIIEPRSITRNTYQALNLQEKPQPEDALSNLAIVGRYILTPDIFDAISVTPPGKNNEIQLTDALQILLKKQPVYACKFSGKRYDTGNPMGWLETNIELGLQDPDLAPGLMKYLKKITTIQR